ncbi:iduronate 2-sulfatase-like [Asterias rubens]|uniref:iduronate 2-sulfatase-like n=1 Tax=Asterias rubens TaxID=7604 RepID=UPI0014557F26|nr:iduronate 2-sulfatase-like [Asterias rubens]
MATLFVWTFLLLLATAVIFINGDSRPNVLFLIIDDFRPALGSYGEQVITPNMDQLAAQSIRFTDAHAQQALCAPSRISFLTSRRPDSTRLWDFMSSYWRDAAGNFTTLPQHFKENGYYTVSLGKVFHRGRCSNFTDDYPLSWSIPAFRPTTKRETKKNKLCPGPDGNLYSYTMCPVNVTKMPKGTLPDIEITDSAISVLRSLSRTKRKVKGKGRHKVTPSTDGHPTPHTPFFIAVGYHKPHLPFRYPEKYKDLYPIETIEMAKNPYFTTNLPPVAWEHWKDVRKGEDIPLSAQGVDYYQPMPDKYHLLMRQAYFATTSYIDHEVGRVLSTLEEEGLVGDTIIVLLGDHGWQLGEHQEWSKYSNFVSATRVPLIFHVPGLTDKTQRHHHHKFPMMDPFYRTRTNRPDLETPSVNYSGESRYTSSTGRYPGFVSNSLVELVDVFPTVAELASLPVPPLCPVDASGVALCTEGVSLVPLIHHITDTPSKVKVTNWKNATFSQYPRPSLFPSHKTNTPSQDRIAYMGYSMRTKKYRYTEWLSFNNSNFNVSWGDPLARELYIYSQDPLEDVNVADMSENVQIVKELSYQLGLNWRHALPVFNEDTTTVSTPTEWYVK